MYAGSAAWEPDSRTLVKSRKKAKYFPKQHNAVHRVVRLGPAEVVQVIAEAATSTDG